MAPIRRCSSAEFPGYKVTRLHPECCACKDLWLVTTHPQHFGSNIERRGSMACTTVNILSASQALAPFPGFNDGAIILVDQATAQGMPVLIKRRNGWRLACEADSLNLRAVWQQGDDMLQS